MYDKIIFIEFIEYLCRILYTKFAADLDSNLLNADKTTSQSKDKGELYEISASHGGSQFGS